MGFIEFYSPQLFLCFAFTCDIILSATRLAFNLETDILISVLFMDNCYSEHM